MLQNTPNAAYARGAARWAAEGPVPRRLARGEAGDAFWFNAFLPMQAALRAAAAVELGLGRIVALHHSSSSLYHIQLENRYLSF